MTGGIGFTKQGQVSNRNNRNLQQGIRKSNYSGSSQQDPTTSNYDEIKKWKDEKKKSENNLGKKILILISIVFILGITAYLIF